MRLVWYKYNAIWFQLQPYVVGDGLLPTWNSSSDENGTWYWGPSHACGSSEMPDIFSWVQELSSYPGYFREPHWFFNGAPGNIYRVTHWFSMRLPEITRITCQDTCPWWRHAMETLSALLCLCEGTPSRKVTLKRCFINFLPWSCGTNSLVAIDLRRMTIVCRHTVILQQMQNVRTRWLSARLQYLHC